MAKKVKAKALSTKAVAEKASPSAEDARAIVRAAGLRITGPRIAVYRHLRTAHAPMSHAEIFEALASEGFDRATIYRNLMDLVEAGLATRVDVGDHVWRFERVLSDTEHSSITHPHFTCNDCGTVSCLDDFQIVLKPRRGVHAKVPGLELGEVHLKGRCEDCV